MKYVYVGSDDKKEPLNDNGLFGERNNKYLKGAASSIKSGLGMIKDSYIRI